MNKKIWILLIILVLLVVIIFFSYTIYTYINSKPISEDVTGNEILNAIPVENWQTTDLSPYVQWMFIFITKYYCEIQKCFSRRYKYIDNNYKENYKGT